MTVFHQVADIKTHISSFTEKKINCDASVFLGYRYMTMLKQMGGWIFLFKWEKTQTHCCMF